MTGKISALLTKIVVSFTFICFAACKTETDKALNYADNLSEAIDKFEDSRKVVVDKVGTAVDKTSVTVSEKKIDVPSLANDWEKEWNSIMTRFKDLEENFSKVGKASSDYFDKLDAMSSSITDEKIKLAELQKNKELKDKYTLAYSDAANNINKIKQVLKEGSDYHKVLVASAMREKITTNMDELQVISLNAKQILVELEKFTIEGKKLVAQ